MTGRLRLRRPPGRPRSSSPRRLRRTAAVLSAAAVLWPAAAPAGQTRQDQPLETAARAARQVTFQGVLLVRWTDGASPRVERLDVQGADGAMMVRGGTEVLASDSRRLVAHGAGKWDLLWPAPAGGGNRPPTTRKYRLAPAPEAVVSGRPAEVIEVWQGTDLAERLYLDRATGLMLRREHFENGPVPDRTVEFESLTLGGSVPAPPSPSAVSDHVPAPAAGSAPGVLGDGYVQIGRYERDGVVHVRYSDGLYDLSVFEQDGRLDRQGLPTGREVRVGRATARHAEWPGGHVMIWEQAGTVYTAVTDGPLDHLLGAVGSLPQGSGQASFLSRLRQVCRALVQPLTR